MLKTEYDVVIIGGGPSGATCSRILADYNIDVLVIEKKRNFDESKVGAALVSPEGYQMIDTYFPELKDSVLSNVSNVYGPIIYYNNVLTIKSNDCQRCYKRQELDTQMLANCKANVIRGAMFKKFIKESGKTIVCFDNNGVENRIICKYLVSAEGYNSSIARQLFPQVIERTQKVRVRQAILYGSSIFEEGHYYMLMTSNSFMNMIVPKDGKIYLIVGNDYGKSIDDTFDEIVENIKTNYKFEGYIAETVDRDVSDLWRNSLVGNGNILLLGESGGIWGQADGIYYGVLTAKFCAEAIIDSFENNVNDVASVYQRLLNENRVLENIKRAHANVVRMSKYYSNKKCNI